MWVQILSSILGGGLAGGLVSTLANRYFHWRSLRTTFYPKLSDFASAYLLRVQNPEGQVWQSRIGYLPVPEDQGFINHRANFFMGLIHFNELREVRKLRRQMMATLEHDGREGDTITFDLMPEYEAVVDCLFHVQKKLRLDA